MHNHSPPILPSQSGMFAIYRMLSTKPRKIVLKTSRQFSRFDQQTVLRANFDIMLFELGHQECASHIESYEARPNAINHISDKSFASILNNFRITQTLDEEPKEQM